MLVLAVAAIHIFLLIFIVIKDTTSKEEELESARLMKLLDFEEIPPPPPEEEILPMVESIAEVMIETETEPVQVVVAPGTLTGPIQAVPTWDDYVSQGKVSEVPRFDEREIASSIVFPPIALRSGIEGRVILELFVDRNGAVQRIIVIREDPEGRGFAEAAIKAFTGKQGTPAKANGEPVSSRFRYPVVFKIK